MNRAERFRAWLALLPLSERARAAALMEYKKDEYAGLEAVAVEYGKDAEDELVEAAVA